MSLSDAYNNFKTLIRQITYSKDDIDEKIGDIDDFINSDHNNVYPSEVVDSVTDNDMRPVSSNAVHDSLSNYVQKSQTAGLLKNDGTVDSNTYLTSHQSLSNCIQKSQTSGLVKNDGTIDTTLVSRVSALENELEDLEEDLLS